MLQSIVYIHKVMKKTMKRMIFSAAIIIAVLSVNAAKAQVGVHIGFRFGTPYYAYPRRVILVNPDYQEPVYSSPLVYYQEPVYYNPAPVNYGPGRVYYQQERDYHERLREQRREFYHRMHEAEEHGYYGRGYWNHHREDDDDRRW